MSLLGLLFYSSPDPVLWGERGSRSELNSGECHLPVWCHSQTICRANKQQEPPVGIYHWEHTPSAVHLCGQYFNLARLQRGSFSRSHSRSTPVGPASFLPTSSALRWEGFALRAEIKAVKPSSVMQQLFSLQRKDNTKDLLCDAALWRGLVCFDPTGHPHLRVSSLQFGLCRATERRFTPESRSLLRLRRSSVRGIDLEVRTGARTAQLSSVRSQSPSLK